VYEEWQCARMKVRVDGEVGVFETWRLIHHSPGHRKYELFTLAVGELSDRRCLKIEHNNYDV